MRWVTMTALLGALVLCGCHEDLRSPSDGGPPDSGVAPIFGDVQYATRCEMTLGCEGPTDRDVCGFDQGEACDTGAPSPSLACAVRVSDSTRTIDFSAQQGGDFSISVEGLTVPFGGGSAMGVGCRVQVVSGTSRYLGACGGSGPSTVQPCRISNVMFGEEDGEPTFQGNIFCQFLQNQANPALQIEVTSIGIGPVSASNPARFRFRGCAGQAP